MLYKLLDELIKTVLSLESTVFSPQSSGNTALLFISQAYGSEAFYWFEDVVPYKWPVGLLDILSEPVWVEVIFHLWPLKIC